MNFIPIKFDLRHYLSFHKGNFNVWNVLAAVTALRGWVEDEAVIRGAAAILQVSGRLERHSLPNGACCFIDFAHTPRLKTAGLLE